jgi:hypothetical protein
LCEEAEASTLIAGLNTTAWNRVHGRQLLTTDALVGLVAAPLAPDSDHAIVCFVVVTLLSFALRMRAEFAWAVRHPRLARAAVIASGVLGVACLIDKGESADLGPLAALGVVLVLPAAALALSLAFRVMSFAESCIAEGFTWRGAVDRLELDRHLRNRLTAADAAAPFGSRLGVIARLKAIPEALRLEKADLAQQAVPPRPDLFGWLAALRRKPGWPRLLWFGAWIAFAILRGIHAFYGS